MNVTMIDNGLRIVPETKFEEEYVRRMFMPVKGRLAIIKGTASGVSLDIVVPPVQERRGKWL